MLALTPNPASKKTTPNLLPCTLNHSGPIALSPRHWAPSSSSSADDNTKTAYFRGRKLRGRTVKIPAGYEGVVLQKTDAMAPTQRGGGGEMAERLRRMEEGGDDDDDDMGVDKEVEVKMLETQATFDELVIWGHEVVPGDEDEYVRGVEEWVAFAEVVG